MRWLLLVAALQQIVFPFFVNPFGKGATPFAAIRIESGIAPAGYAFAIWGPIYAAAVAFSVWQVLPAGRSDPATARVLMPVILLYLCSSLWLAAAKFGPLWATMPIIVVMTLCALFALWAASVTPAGTAARWWLMAAPFALYAGWLSCATFVNIADLAPGYGWDRFGLTRDAYAIVSLVAAVGVALAVLWATRGNPVYAATIAWALVAIIVACRMRGLPDSIAVTSLGGIAAVAAASWWWHAPLSSAT